MQIKYEYKCHWTLQWKNLISGKHVSRKCTLFYTNLPHIYDYVYYKGR